MKLVKTSRILLLIVVLTVSVVAQETTPRDWSWPEGDPEAVEEWKDLRFGMFIHWGPVSLTGHEIGWSRGRETPVEEYDNLYKQFNPVRFDAEEWVKIAKAAGMKYMVITSKHHDGFSIWPSEVTDYDIGETPFGRDVLKELSQACRKHGIQFGTYYSVCDWYHPEFPVGNPRLKNQDKPDADLAEYDRFLRAQVRELVANYGPLLTMWFDVPQVYDYNYGVDMVKELRALQPDLVINNRAFSDGRLRQFNRQTLVGDYSTPEQHIGEFNLDRPWETCMTICKQWAWKPNDKLKSLEECIHTLVRTNGGDGNLLLNVGPMPDGRIEQRQVKRLKEMGEWLEKNGEAIYGTRGGPFEPTENFVSTNKGNKIYVHVLKWPDSGIELPPIKKKIVSAKLVDGENVSLSQSAESIRLDVPQSLRDPFDTIIVLDLK